MSDTGTLHPIWNETTQQRLYRQLLLAMSYPGRVVALPSEAASAGGASAVVACLCDHATSLADPAGLLSPEVVSLSEARRLPPGAAAYEVHAAGGPAPADWQPRLGTIPAPEESTTLILAGCSFEAALPVLVSTWRGPGIESQRRVAIGGLHRQWLLARAVWCSRPPLGVDMILCGDEHLCCLPRSTQVQIED